MVFERKEVWMRLMREMERFGFLVGGLLVRESVFRFMPYAGI